MLENWIQNGGGCKLFFHYLILLAYYLLLRKSRVKFKMNSTSENYKVKYLKNLKRYFGPKIHLQQYKFSPRRVLTFEFMYLQFLSVRILIKTKMCTSVFLTFGFKAHILRVTVQGVESLWGDCMFIPADWGSQQQICAILLFLKTFHYKNDLKCKSISIFFLKNNKHAKWPQSDLTPWTLTLDVKLRKLTT